MADTDVLIKDLPLTETVNDSDDLVTEDSSPTTHRIKASVVKNYINAEQNEELDGIKVDLDNTNANIGSLSSKVDDATTTVSSMQANLNSMDGRVQANADGISELNSALADFPQIQTGRFQTTANSIPAGETTTVGTITFTTAFNSTPKIFFGISGVNSTNYGYLNISAASVSTTGFSVQVHNSSTSSSLQPTISWLAIS